MHTIRILFWFPLLFLWGNNFAAGLDTLGVKKNFEWGEYDSLLLKLPSILADSAHNSSAVQAQYWQYLGVAYFAGGDTLRAKECYTSAHKIDSNAVLDSNYLNQTSKTFFSKLALSLQTPKQGKMDSLEVASQVPLPAEIPPLDELVIPPGIPIPVKLRPKPVNSTPFLTPQVKKALGWGMLALGLGLTHYTLVEQDENDEIYKDYKYAGSLGDGEEFKRLKNELEKSNLKLLIFSTGAVLSMGSGMVFTFYPFKMVKGPPHTTSAPSNEVAVQFKKIF